MAKSPQYIRLINTARWRRLRAHVIREANGMCRRCMKEGRVSAATEVHHIRPVESAKDPQVMEQLAYDPANLIALCHDCHRLTHSELGKNSKQERKKRSRAEVDAFHRLLFGNDPRE